MQIRCLRPLFLSITATAGLFSAFAETASTDSELKKLYQTQIPRQETGALEFIQNHPEYDGRGTVIAIFDTGVDPAAPGMQFTTTGERKIVDIIDASGAGDVDMTTLVKPEEDGTIKGLTGRLLTIPSPVTNPSGEFRIGVKNGKELFHKGVWNRMMDYRKQELQNKLSQKNAQRYVEARNTPEATAETEVQKREKKALKDMRAVYEKDLLSSDPGPYYDCVMWNDGTRWNVIVDTDEDGDLKEEKILSPFGIDGEYASFPDHVAMNFGVQVYQEGAILSIVTTSGSHGTHVAGIAAANFPSRPDFNGVAPGARILSVRMGDVRIGGSSNYTGENRATATAAQYGVDVMNASWGGQSVYQDGSTWGCELYNELAEKYGITCFVSAGNDGPALSTVGSPGGETTHSIGVGAYISPEMGDKLYSVIDDSPETVFMFTARGPARNGDLGVNIVAPGAAIAPLAFDSLNASDLYNGTSMAAPSAAGIGALLISAAKQENVAYSPARIKQAVMQTAKPLDHESPFSQGSGLVQVPAAWNYLKSTQEIAALDAFYKITVGGNRYSNGPGLYLRGDLPTGVRSYTTQIRPIFPEELTSDDQYAYEAHFALESNAPWLKVPEFLHLSNAGNSFRPEVHFDQLPHDGANGVYFAKISASLTHHPEAGNVFEIPFTIVTGEEPEDDKFETYEVEIGASKTARRFFQTPKGATSLHLEIERSSDQNVEKLMVLHALTLTANTEITEFETAEYFRLKSGQNRHFEIPVLAGEVLELSIHQAWAYDDPATYKIKGEWKGVRIEPSSIQINSHDHFVQANLKTLNAPSVEAEANLNLALVEAEMKSSEIFPGDLRGNYPAWPGHRSGKQSFWLRQEFEWQSEKDQSIRPLKTEFHTEFHAGGGNIYCYDEKGILIGSTLAPVDEDEDTVRVPKGKIKIIREFVSPNQKALTNLEKNPLLLAVGIDPLTPKTYLGYDSLNKGQTSTSFSTVRDRRYALFVSPAKVEDLKIGNPAPYALTGEIEFTDGDQTVTTLPIVQHLSSPKAPQNGASADAEPVSDLTKSLYSARLNFLKTTRTAEDAKTVARRNSVISELEDTKTITPEIELEILYRIGFEKQLLHPWMITGTPEGYETAKEVLPKDLRVFLKQVERVIDSCKPAQVAQYLGAVPHTNDDTPAEKQSQAKTLEDFQKRKKWICQANLLAADAYLIAQQLPLASKQLKEAKRWAEDKANLEFCKFEAYFNLEAGYPGIALQFISKGLKKGSDETLETLRAKIYEELGWEIASDWKRLKTSLNKNANRQS
ncbi:MAG: S8 family serine peptidase [Opitutales bacterium]|nr:S8 family serine peptidase [Opitutales bacterium]